MKTYYILRLASWLSRYVPPRIAYWLCSLLGGVLFYVKPSIRAAVMDNMRHVLPNSTRHERRNLARKVIRNTAKNYFDLVRLPHLTKEDLERMVTVHGVEHLEHAVAQGKGAILMSGHIGSFSVVPQIAAIRGYKLAIVAEDIKPPRLYNYVNYLRSPFGIKFINARSSEVRLIYKLLRGNGVLMLAADRDVTDAGEPVRFFDAEADLPPGPVVLSMRLRAPLIPAHTVRLPDNTSIVTVYPPLELERTGDYEKDVRTNLRKVAQVLEQMILEDPSQWVVLQRVWDRPEQDTLPAEKAEVATDGNNRDEEIPGLQIKLPQTQTEERSPSSVTR